MRRAALLGLLVIAGCGSPEQPTSPKASLSPSPVAPTQAPTATQPTALPSEPTPQPMRDLSLLDSRECPTVVQAYVDALARKDFEYAARAWDDPVVDGDRLKALFSGYKQPAIAFTGSEQEGAAGSSYCTVTGALTDAGDAKKTAKKGEIVLKRVNDVPGATPQQLRWTIRSSTFIEKIERTS